MHNLQIIVLLIGCRASKATSCFFTSTVSGVSFCGAMEHLLIFACWSSCHWAKICDSSQKQKNIQA